MMTSEDITTPVVRPRREKLWTFVDPLGFRENFRYEFEIDLLDVLETESTARIMVGDRVLKTGSTYNDYYGFGTSRKEAVREAEHMREDLIGANIDIVVSTTLFTSPVFIDEKKSSRHRHGVKCFRVPSTWYRQDSNAPLSHRETFHVWRNGVVEPDATRLDQIIKDARMQDAAGDWRNTPFT